MWESVRENGQRERERNAQRECVREKTYFLNSRTEKLKSSQAILEFYRERMEREHRVRVELTKEGVAVPCLTD